MSKKILIDLFAEDRAHEEWLGPLLQRLAGEEGQSLRIRVRSARGGHGQAIKELRTYQKGLEHGVAGVPPDLLVVAIDTNCSSLVEARKLVRESLQRQFHDRTICATPDPHIERWFLADLQAFHDIVGITPAFESGKCERGYYKQVLAEAVKQAGHPPILGGIEFARELVGALDYFRAGKADPGLKHFLDDIKASFRSR